MAVWNAGNVAPYIPELWSTIVQVAEESNLVFGLHCDRRFEAELAYGDWLHIPLIADFGSPSAINTTNDLTTYSTNQTCVNICVNYHYQQSVQLGEVEQLQDHPDILVNALKKCGYSVSKQMDTHLGALVTGGTSSEGTMNTALTADVLINAYEGLNELDVPDGDRLWVFDAESITDLLKLDYFVRMDYVADSVVSKGFSGRQIFGAPVYMTTNLAGTATGHEAAYYHPEAILLVSQMSPTVFRFDWPQRFSQVVGVKTLYGVRLARANYMVTINTRS